MGSSFRFGLLVCGCFVTSLATGWICRPIFGPVAAIHAAIPTKAAVPEKPRGIIPAVQPSIVSPAELANRESIRIRSETAAWYKKRDRNHFFSSTPFINADFGMGLAMELGLAPAEVEQLNAALRRTQRDLDELALRTATAQTSADGKKLTVMVPSSPAESSRIYDELLAAVTNVLGPERLKLFREISGDGFDRSFDQFGLNPVQYELTLQPTVLRDGTQAYPFIRSYLVAGETGSSGNDSGNVSVESIRKDYPILARFLPSDFGKSSGK